MKVQNLSHSVHATIVGVRARQTEGKKEIYAHINIRYEKQMNMQEITREPMLLFPNPFYILHIF